jgi:hypothetical protein
MAWTTPGTAVAGNVLTAAFWNEQVRDNMDSVLSSGKVALFQHTTASGVSGGTATSGSWQTRTLNTQRFDTIGLTLSSNQVSLVAGTYFCHYTGIFFSGVAEGEHRLYNSTDSTVISKAQMVYNTGNVSIPNIGWALFTIAGTKNIRLEYRVQNTVNSNGLGQQNPWSEENIFAQLLIFKVS